MVTLRLAVVLAATAACTASGGDAVTVAPISPWLVAPPPPIIALGPLRGSVGRGDAAATTAPIGIVGSAGLAPLHGEVEVWQVPGDGPARAIASSGSAVELVEVDRGAVRWRVGEAGRVVAGTAEVVVLADDAGLRGIAVADGKQRWTDQAPGVTPLASGDRIVVAAGSGVDVIDVATGSATEHVALPANVVAMDVLAACPGEVFARVAAVAAARGTPATPAGLVHVAGGKIAWRVAVADLGGPAQAVDSDCTASALVTAGDAIVAITRATGAITGRATGVRGWWPTLGTAGSIDLATSAGVWRRPRDLSTAGVLVPELPAVGARIATRGDRVLARATPRTAAVLDRDGARAVVPLAEATAAFGEHAVVAGGDTLRAFALPVALARDARIPAAHAGVAIAAELRDLPAVHALDDGGATPAPGGDRGSADRVSVALDEDDPSVVYVRTDTSVGRISATTHAWAWRRDVDCHDMAVARATVVCTAGADIVGLNASDGATRWRTELRATAIAAAGDTVVAFTGGRATLLATTGGWIRGELASDDGGPVVAVPVALRARAPTTLVFAVMRGRLVALVPAAAMVPLWSLTVAGTATRISAAGDGALLELEGGDAYRVDVDGHVTAMPALGQTWRGDADALAASCAGGPVPPDPMPSPPPRPPPPPTPTTTTQAPSSFENAAPIAVPWPPPPAMAASWQLAVYDLDGALRARNDYALVSPVTIAPRAAAAPIVVASAPHAVLVLDPRTGDPLRRIDLPDAPAAAFATVVADQPVAGVVLAHPLRVVWF